MTELLALGVLTAGIVVWSLWDGYLAEPTGRRLSQRTAAGVTRLRCHTSGHTSQLVSALKPRRVVPIHTEGASQFARHFPAVTPQEDGIWWAA